MNTMLEEANPEFTQWRKQQENMPLFLLRTAIVIQFIDKGSCGQP